MRRQHLFFFCCCCFFVVVVACALIAKCKGANVSLDWNVSSINQSISINQSLSSPLSSSSIIINNHRSSSIVIVVILIEASQVEMTSVTRLCHTKSLVSINGQFPGPTVYVREGDAVTVRVTNSVPYNITIHW
jgi:hypothetical protein